MYCKAILNFHLAVGLYIQYSYIRTNKTRCKRLKHLENGLMMFTTKENCTVYSKRSLYVYKNKKQKKYSRQMHQNIDYVS